MIGTHITAEAIADVPTPDSLSGAGSELVFLGRVRPQEEGRAIVALDYEQYAGMAGTELRALAEEASGRFGLLDLLAIHRVGRVPVGEASLKVVIRSRHRREGIDALTWFIAELKRRVPIWKWGVTADGERFPSHHQGD